MKKQRTSPNYTKILYMLYAIISLVALTIFFFVSTPSLDEYIGIYAVAMWATILAAVIAVVLAINELIKSVK